MRIEMLVFDGVDEMDVMGPFEVWSHAAARSGELEVVLVGLDGPVEVTGMHGLQFRAPAGLGTPNGLFVPGGGWLNQAESGAWVEPSAADCRPGSPNWPRGSTGSRRSVPARCCSVRPGW